MERESWMIDIAKKNGRTSLNTFAIGVIEGIMGELHTSAEEKVIETCRTLIDLGRVKHDQSLPWDLSEIKKLSAPTESPVENSHLDCTIDASKVESLIPYPAGITHAPGCDECGCFGCSHFPRCHLFLPTTKHFCQNECKGQLGIRGCEYSDKERSQ